MCRSCSDASHLMIECYNPAAEIGPNLTFGEWEKRLEPVFGLIDEVRTISPIEDLLESTLDSLFR